MQVRAELPLQYAFVLKAKHVHAIWQVLADAIGQVEATAWCADHLERPFTSAHALTDYENSRARQIMRLEFSAKSSDPYQEAYLCLGGRSLSSITLRLVGREPMVSRTKDTLADILDGMRPWYSPFACVDSSYIMLLGFFVLMIGSFLLPGDGKGDLGSAPFWSKIFVVMLGLIVLSIVGVLIWGLIRLRNRCFPVATFAIGQGEERYRVDGWIREGVLIGSLLFGLVIRNILSTVWSLIASKIGGSP